MPVLEVVDLKKRFGDFYALNGVDLRLNHGEIHGFIGPNGAGKTTTIRILLGLLKASAGTATIFGKDAWTHAVEIHKRVGYVPGEVNLWPNLTGGEVLDFFGRLQGTKNNQKRRELIDRFELDPTKKCGTYSKGNRQKVALIAAFASDADLYLLDEPTSGLDPLMEQVFREYLRSARDQGKSVLLSSHILSEVEKLGDRISIIREGQIIESGTMDELRHLTSTVVEARTIQPIIGLDGLPGVHDLSEQDGVTRFSVDAENLGSAIAHLAQFELTKLESASPTLEDLFIRHYRQEEDPA